jgi:phytoene/squalene synthetase
MTPNIAEAITRDASRQSYYTIRFLVDKDRVEDAFLAYAYFRWVDDILDTTTDAEAAGDSGAGADRLLFLRRQLSLLECCLKGKTMQVGCDQEDMLVELARRNQGHNRQLCSYMQNMMRVMEFDTRRRGRLITQAELDACSRRLAVAVTDAMHYFIGHGQAAPRDGRRYLAATGAHIIHMLRDTVDDLHAGYYNIPREILEAGLIGPWDIHSDAYRSWVRRRVDLARRYFQAGREYYRQLSCLRHRLAGCAYMARFEWLAQIIEEEGFRLRPEYDERKSLFAGLAMGRMMLAAMLNTGANGKRPAPGASYGQVKA